MFILAIFCTISPKQVRDPLIFSLILFQILEKTKTIYRLLTKPFKPLALAFLVNLIISVEDKIKYNND